MIQNAEMIVELFDNGITTKWKDLDGDIDSEHKVFLEGNEKVGIGSAIWGDVSNVMDFANTSKVKITIKYEPIQEEKG
jgi:hypothetical protein